MSSPPAAAEAPRPLPSRLRLCSRPRTCASVRVCVCVTESSWLGQSSSRPRHSGPPVPGGGVAAAAAEPSEGHSPFSAASSALALRCLQAHACAPARRGRKGSPSAKGPLVAAHDSRLRSTVQLFDPLSHFAVRVDLSAQRGPLSRMCLIAGADVPPPISPLHRASLKTHIAHEPLRCCIATQGSSIDSDPGDASDRAGGNRRAAAPLASAHQGAEGRVVQPVAAQGAVRGDGGGDARLRARRRARSSRALVCSFVFASRVEGGSRLLSRRSGVLPRPSPAPEVSSATWREWRPRVRRASRCRLRSAAMSLAVGVPPPKLPLQWRASCSAPEDRLRIPLPLSRQ